MVVDFSSAMAKTLGRRLGKVEGVDVDEEPDPKMSKLLGESIGVDMEKTTKPPVNFADFPVNDAPATPPDPTYSFDDKSEKPAGTKDMQVTPEQTSRFDELMGVTESAKEKRNSVFKKERTVAPFEERIGEVDVLSDEDIESIQEPMERGRMKTFRDMGKMINQAINEEQEYGFETFVDAESQGGINIGLREAKELYEKKGEELTDKSVPERFMDALGTFFPGQRIGEGLAVGLAKVAPDFVKLIAGEDGLKDLQNTKVDKSKIIADVAAIPLTFMGGKLFQSVSKMKGAKGLIAKPLAGAVAGGVEGERFGEGETGAAIGAATPMAGLVSRGIYKILPKSLVGEGEIARRVSVKSKELKNLIMRTTGEIDDKVIEKELRAINRLDAEKAVDTESATKLAYDNVRTDQALKQELYGALGDKNVDPAKLKLKTPGGFETNPVKDALDDMYKVYGEVGREGGEAGDELVSDSVRRLYDKFQKEGSLTPSELDELAATYGSKFRSKSFKASGELKEKFGKVSDFEGTRQGLQEVTTNLMPDKVTRELNKQMHESLKLGGSLQELIDEAKKFETKLDDPGIMRTVRENVGQKVRKFKSSFGVGDTSLRNLTPQDRDAIIQNRIKNIQRLSKELAKVEGVVDPEKARKAVESLNLMVQKMEKEEALMLPGINESSFRPLTVTGGTGKISELAKKYKTPQAFIDAMKETQKLDVAQSDEQLRQIWEQANIL